MLAKHRQLFDAPYGAAPAQHLDDQFGDALGVANTTTAFDQFAPDILWTGSSLVVAWTDTSNATTGPDVRFRTFDANLNPTSAEQTLAATPDSEGDVTLATFEGSWAAAWRDDANGLETLRVHTGTTDWTVGPAFVPPSVTTKLALVELDANDLLLLYSIGNDPDDSGIPNASSALQFAVLSLTGPWNVTGTPVPANTSIEDAAAADDASAGQLAYAYVNAVNVQGTIFVAWWTSAITGDPNGEQLWFQPVGWSDTTLSWAATVSLPRTVADQPGNQRAPALAESTLEPNGALLTAWDDLGDTEQEAGEAKGDVIVELMPVPVLRIGGQ